MFVYNSLPIDFDKCPRGNRALSPSTVDVLNCQKFSFVLPYSLECTGRYFERLEYTFEKGDGLNSDKANDSISESGIVADGLAPVAEMPHESDYSTLHGDTITKTHPHLQHIINNNDDVRV